MAQDIKERIELGMERKDFSERREVAKLTLETYKNLDGGILSRSDVSWFYGTGYVHAFGCAESGDWSKRVLLDRNARATQKNIDAQHARVFTPEVRAQLEADARAWYARQDTKKTA